VRLDLKEAWKQIPQEKQTDSTNQTKFGFCRLAQPTVPATPDAASYRLHLALPVIIMV
jgi:hypothetical protein